MRTSERGQRTMITRRKRLNVDNLLKIIATMIVAFVTAILCYEAYLVSLHVSEKSGVSLCLIGSLGFMTSLSFAFYKGVYQLYRSSVQPQGRWHRILYFVVAGMGVVGLSTLAFLNEIIWVHYFTVEPSLLSYFTSVELSAVVFAFYSFGMLIPLCVEMWIFVFISSAETRKAKKRQAQQSLPPKGKAQ